MTQSSTGLPATHQTMLLAHRAMVRDMDRVTRVAESMAMSPAPEQAAALKAYTDQLFELIEHHHQGEDEFLWPRLRQSGVDEAALALMNSEHGELSALLHRWHEAGHGLGGDPGAAFAFAKFSKEVHDLLAQHAADEERELSGRLASALSVPIWKGFARHMRKTAPGWTLRFMPPWLASVAGPNERGGVPTPPVAALFRGWLERRQRAAFGEHY